jgi:hypothetical protein
MDFHHCDADTFNHQELRMSKRMTPWFPSKIKPVRAGVYEVSTPNSLANKYAYFDKKGWRLCASSVESAAREGDWPYELSDSSMYLPGSKWRGFTKEQK